MKKIILLIFLALVSLNAGDKTVDDSGYKWKTGTSFSIAYYFPKNGDSISMGFLNLTPFSLYTKSFNFNIEVAMGGYLVDDEIHKYANPFRFTLSSLYR